MFIKKDLRKIPTILSDATKAAANAQDNIADDGDDKNTAKLLDLRLQRRKAEFNGSVKILCQPENAPALDHLQSLSLYDCEIRSLEGIGMLSKLQTLNVGRNPLSSLPDELASGCKSLEEIWLEDCSFEGPLPEPLLKMTTLKNLRISNNRLTHLPAEIGNLADLCVLCLDNNQLKSLPTELCHLKKLTTLLIRENQLRDLPDGVFASNELKLLHASSNQLVHLPDSLVDCISLTHLYLNSNLLESIPVGVDLMRNLQRLNLSHNRIGELPTVFFQSFGDPDTQGQCSKRENCVVLLLDNPVVKQKLQDNDAKNDDNSMDATG